MSQPNLSPCPALSTSEFGSHCYHADRQRQTDRAGSLILDEAPRSAGTIGRGVRSAAKGSAVASLALTSRHANVDSPRRHLGVFLLGHEVELGRSDIRMPGKLAHLVHLRPVADGVVNGGLAKRMNADAP